MRSLLRAGSWRIWHENNITASGIRRSASGSLRSKQPSGRRIAEAEAGSAMLPGMAAKPRVAIVGAGNFGSALASALQQAGYAIEAVIAVARGEIVGRRKLARNWRNRWVLARRAICRAVRAELIWFCVPDSAIARAAECAGRESRVEGKSRAAFQRSAYQR